MRILIVSNLFPPDVIGGYELGCLRIAQALANQGHHIVVATSEPRKATGLPECDDRLDVRRMFRPVWDFEVRFEVDRHVPPRAAKLLRIAVVDIPAVVSLRRLLEEEAFDVAYVFNLIGLGPFGIMETLLSSSLPCVVHLMDNIDTVIAGNVRSGGLLSRFAHLKSQFSAVSCSRGCLHRNSRIGTYGDSSVLYSGVEKVSVTGNRPERPSHSTAFRFAYTGQVVGQKGIGELVTAFHHLQSSDEHKNAELHLIGGIQGGYETELAQMIGSEAMNRSVFVHGRKSRDEAIALLGTMDLGVYPLSAAEAFGYAPIECLAAGVPAIISRQAGCSELLPAGYPLFVSRREDVLELTQLMSSAMRDESLRIGALDCFESTKRDFDFDTYTLPRITTALATAKRNSPAASFGDMIQFYRFIGDYATMNPGAVFYGF